MLAQQRQFLNDLVRKGKAKFPHLIVIITMNADDLEMDKEEVLKECFELVRVLG